MKALEKRRCPARVRRGILERGGGGGSSSGASSSSSASSSASFFSSSSLLALPVPSRPDPERAAAAALQAGGRAARRRRHACAPAGSRGGVLHPHPAPGAAGPGTYRARLPRSSAGLGDGAPGDPARLLRPERSCCPGFSPEMANAGVRLAARLSSWERETRLLSSPKNLFFPFYFSFFKYFKKKRNQLNSSAAGVINERGLRLSCSSEEAGVAGCLSWHCMMSYIVLLGLLLAYCTLGLV